MTPRLNGKACSVNKPSQIQGRGISWQDTVHCVHFWDAERILLIDYMPHKLTITGVYSTDLFRKLLVAVKEKRRGKSTQVGYPYFCMALHLLTGHIGPIGQAVVLKCGFEEIRAIYHNSPDHSHQTPNDYHLFPNSKFKKHLRGLRFLTDDELKYAAKEWSMGQSEQNYFIS